MKLGKISGLLILAGLMAAFSAGAGPLQAAAPLELSGGQEASFRFLWPRDPSRPGADLVELAGRANGPEAEEFTPAGRALVTPLDLALPTGQAVAHARVMKLQDHEGAYIFEIETATDITAPTGKFDRPHFALPALKAPRAYSHVLTFAVEEFVTPTHRPIPTTGPVVLFSQDLEVMIISPLDNFMDALTAPDGGEWQCGFGGLTERVPAGTVTKTLVVSGRGINKTFMEWGRIISAWHGHHPADPYADAAMSKLGYWTDNGSYYYYRTEPGMNYQDTLLAVKKYADEARIPYGYFQIDSWWYPKAEIELRSSHNRGGTMLWEPIPEMFPHGLAAFTKKLGLPLVAHNRYTADTSPYCGRYQCALGNDPKRRGALPIDPAFWDEIMDNALKFGIQVYEQDWLYTHIAMIPWLRQGLGNGASWYDAMAQAAAARGLTMQLCMASPELFMQQLKHNNASHARVSHDYKGGLAKSFFWVPFHEASLFAWSVGLWPFKDNFQTTVGQRATYMIIPEASPFEEALIASLSGGPVGPSDRIGYSDRELIMRTCRDDGVLLKPDRPATPIDIMFLGNDNMALGGVKPWIISTESSHAIGASTYLSAFNIWPYRMGDPSVSMADLGLDPAQKYIIYNWKKRTASAAGKKIKFGRMPSNIACYYVIAPLLANGMAVIGEPDKFITLSRKRFQKIALEGGAVRIEMEGVPGEKVSCAVYSPAAAARVAADLETGSAYDPAAGIQTISLAFPASGKARLTLTAGE
ncbi:MAG TPA: hypothetical protein VM658_06140 [bacterium]|nr:hypothetical protein [bacterium]